jgi:GNAT superfamily N-acetyltransferase
VIEYRPFQNSDPPALVEIWRSHAQLSGLAQPMSVPRLEQMVLAKSYFVHEGLIVAVEDGRPIGFVHAGFGPNEAETELCTDLGVTCLLLVAPHPERENVARELLARAETYLRDHGAKVLYAGLIRPLTPFYVGLYGGSEPPGVMEDDTQAAGLYRSEGYREIDRTVTLHLDLAAFRPAVSRAQLQLRRLAVVDQLNDVPATSWWQACMLGPFECVAFRLRYRDGAPAPARALFWYMDPVAGASAVHTAGLYDLDVDAEHRRHGLATALLIEAFRRLREEGISRIETHTMERNTAARGLYHKLGFIEGARGAVLRKEST